MKISKEGISGPIAAHQGQDGRWCALPNQTKAKHFLTVSTEVIQITNDSAYGLASAVSTQNIKRAIKTIYSFEAGTTFVRVKMQYLCVDSAS